MEASVELVDENGNIVFSEYHLYESEINCAYDPNDKLVDPEMINFSDNTLFGDTVIYTIRFQNTGTDTAFNIRLEDPLDENLDWSTFQVVAASHPYSVYMDEDGQLIFHFNNILLPDSTTNFAGSQGFVKYSIQTITGPASNISIDNFADIFFDFNPPVRTNTASLYMTTGIAENLPDDFKFIVFPNPSKGDVDIVLELSRSQNWQLQVFNYLGQSLRQYYSPVGGSDQKSLTIKNLKDGVYFFTLKLDQQIRTEKVIITPN